MPIICGGVGTAHNPKAMLEAVSQEKLTELSQDDSFVSHVERVKRVLDRYLSMNTWYAEYCSDYSNLKFAYFFHGICHT
ncbi:MAG: DUF3417 domain-containing protein [Endomicrobium sp.]|nr:DUF3417 domain-containing protein [Endomicrobium sp.]